MSDSDCCVGCDCCDTIVSMIVKIYDSLTIFLIGAGVDMICVSHLGICYQESDLF